MTVYTSGVWMVKPGEGNAFVAAWNDLATRTKAQYPEATAVLLRDQADSNRFVSVGPWASLEEIEAWRDSELFRECVGAIRAHLDGFEPSTLDLVTDVK